MVPSSYQKMNDDADQQSQTLSVGTTPSGSRQRSSSGCDRFSERSAPTVNARTPSPQSANTRAAPVCMVRGTCSQQAESECTKWFKQAVEATAVAERCSRDLFCKAKAAAEDILHFSLTMNSQLGNLLIVQLKGVCQQDEGSYYGKILAAAKSLSNHPRWTSNKRPTASA